MCFFGTTGAIEGRGLILPFILLEILGIVSIWGSILNWDFRNMPLTPCSRYPNRTFHVSVWPRFHLKTDSTRISSEFSQSFWFSPHSFLYQA